MSLAVVDVDEHEVGYYCRGVYGIWDTEAWGPQNPWTASCTCGWKSRQESKAELLAACEQHVVGEWVEKPTRFAGVTSTVLVGRLRHAAPEAITRAIADSSPHGHDGDFHWCVFCDVTLPVKVDDHAPACPWRLAVEWTAANPAAPTSEA